ncbi:nitronate monooxygenase [Saxibacter everestensis]|uniref:Nitronate monooxygenase n=1 Tax=Saxibacter everestensis TaxID=2909229 RepID=A0ABY8QS24_9MICO|nr:nitronate monooxygenase [Brevibacteriaceae bacterium ZFBP1038]
MLKTWLTQTLDLSVPIISAPMASRAGGELAHAVSAAGGLGMLGAGRVVSPEWIAENATIARYGPIASSTDGDGVPSSPGTRTEAALSNRNAGTGGEITPLRFGIGLMTWAIDEDRALLDASLATGPALISLSFGDPSPYVEDVHSVGSLAAMQVNTLADLRLAETAGIDLIIVQGAEAGGHTGQRATLPLLQDVLESTELPVVAAGGISTGRGLAAVLAAGAHGAMIGTALLASPEVTMPEGLRERILAAESDDTVYTSVFDLAQRQPWPSRWGGRALRNEFTDRWHGRGSELADDADAAGEVRAANSSGDPGNASVYAGEAVGAVRESLPAGEVIQRINAEAEARLRSLL